MSEVETDGARLLFFLRSYDKKAPPVSMSKLLSHGYVEEKKKSPNDDDASSTTQGIDYGFVKMQSAVGCSSPSVCSSLGAEIMSPFSIFYTYEILPGLRR